MQLEDSLDVTIDEDDLGDVRTVGDAVDLILAASAANVSTVTDPAGPTGATDHGAARVVVTGMGVKAPGGLTVDELWAS